MKEEKGEEKRNDGGKEKKKKWRMIEGIEWTCVRERIGREEEGEGRGRAKGRRDQEGSITLYHMVWLKYIP